MTTENKNPPEQKPAERQIAAFDFMIAQKKETCSFDWTIADEKPLLQSLGNVPRRSTYKGKLFLITPGGPSKICGFPDCKTVDMV